MTANRSNIYADYPRFLEESVTVSPEVESTNETQASTQVTCFTPSLGELEPEIATQIPSNVSQPVSVVIGLGYIATLVIVTVALGWQIAAIAALAIAAKIYMNCTSVGRLQAKSTA